MIVRNEDLAKFEGKLVRVIFTDGRRTVGKLQRDLTKRCWEVLRPDSDKPRGSPPGVGEILFMQDVSSVEEFKLH